MTNMWPSNDGDSLRAISPVALSSYARSEGWAKAGVYWQYSDIYSGDERPDIILPRTDVIDDYAMAVSDLIAVFARVLERDERTVYRDLTLVDRDVMRVRVRDADTDGLAFESSRTLLGGTRGMLIAAFKSLGDDQPVYSPRPSQDVIEYLNRLRFGHTEGGSFSLILISPALSPPLEPSSMEHLEIGESDPRERQVAGRLSDSLFAMRSALERAVGGDAAAFRNVTASGVSANLCEAVAEIVESVSTFDVSFSWAMTRSTETKRGPVAFSGGDVSLLREAAQKFRAQTPDFDRRLYGFIYRLTRPQDNIYGTVMLHTSINRRERRVTAVLNQLDYSKAIEAHRTRAMVSLEGDLESSGQRWHLRNARLMEMLQAPPLPGLEESNEQ